MEYIVDRGYYKDEDHVEIVNRLLTLTIPPNEKETVKDDGDIIQI